MICVSGSVSCTSDIQMQHSSILAVVAVCYAFGFYWREIQIHSCVPFYFSLNQSPIIGYILCACIYVHVCMYVCLVLVCVILSIYLSVCVHVCMYVCVCTQYRSICVSISISISTSATQRHPSRIESQHHTANLVIISLHAQRVACTCTHHVLLNRMPSLYAIDPTFWLCKIW